MINRTGSRTFADLNRNFRLLSRTIYRTIRVLAERLPHLSIETYLDFCVRRILSELVHRPGKTRHTREMIIISQNGFHMDLDQLVCHTPNGWAMLLSRRVMLFSFYRNRISNLIYLIILIFRLIYEANIA